MNDDPACTTTLTQPFLQHPDRAPRSCVLPDLSASTRDEWGLHTRAMTLRGQFHELTGDPRQDSYGLLAAQDWLLVAVADGVGSCRWSQLGSAAAIEAVLPGVAALLDHAESPDDVEFTEPLHLAVEACVAVARSHDLDPHEVATTLTLAAVARRGGPDGSRRCLLAVVGDSPPMVLTPPSDTHPDDPRQADWFYPIRRDPEASNVVHCFLPGAVAGAVQLGLTLPPGAVLILATDGFSTPLADGKVGLGPALAQRWLPGPRPLLPFLVDLSFTAHGDDRTVVAIWNHTHEPEGPRQ